jgi:hypothetical protein
MTRYKETILSNINLIRTNFIIFMCFNTLKKEWKPGREQEDEKIELAYPL